MKRMLAGFAAVILALPAFAGISYEFKSVGSGIAEQTIAGSVRAEGSRTRVDFSSGDGMIFTAGSYALTDGGTTIHVVDPGAKTFFDLDTAQLLGGADSLLRQFGDSVKIDIRNPQVSVKPAGSGGSVAGFAAQKSRVDSAYDMALDALGQKMLVQMQMTTDVWWTDKLGSEFTNFLQMRGFRTGVEAVDKMLAAQTAAVKGFPLKQITTMKIVLNGNPITTTTTSEVANVKQAKIDETVFALPQGFRKVPSPLEKMLSR